MNLKDILDEKLNDNDVNIADIIIEYKKDMEGFETYQKKHKKVMIDIKMCVLRIKRLFYCNFVRPDCYTPCMMKFFSKKQPLTKLRKQRRDDWKIPCGTTLNYGINQRNKYEVMMDMIW